MRRARTKSPSPYRSPGRPEGSTVSLLNDDDRFELAAQIALTACLGMKKYDAAKLVLFIFSPNPIAVSSIAEGRLFLASILHTTTTILGRAGATARKVNESIKRASDEEKKWLVQSAGLFASLVMTVFAGATLPARACLSMLENDGWGGTLNQIAARLEIAFRSNAAPFEGQLNRAGKALLSRASEKVQIRQ